jgi:hypothetical protein
MDSGGAPEAFAKPEIGKAMSGTRTKLPRQRSAYEEAVAAEEDAVRELRARSAAVQFAQDVTHLSQGNEIFSSRGDDRIALRKAVWNMSSGMNGSISESNPALVGLLQTIVDCNSSDPTERQETQIEALLTVLSRVRSIHEIPLLTVRISLEAYRVNVPNIFWRFIAKLLPGVLLSDTWVEDFIPLAMQERPQPRYEELSGVGACIFDNYQRRLLYKSHVTMDGGGYIYKMTNWATLRIPKHLADPDFDPMHACAQLNLNSSCNLFACT